MTVRELMAELAKYDADKDVVFITRDSITDIGKVDGPRWGMSNNVVCLVEEGEE